MNSNIRISPTNMCSVQGSIPHVFVLIKQKNSLGVSHKTFQMYGAICDPLAKVVKARACKRREKFEKKIKARAWLLISDG